MMQMLRRHVMTGAIAGAVATVGLIAIAGVFIVFFAAAAGGALGAVAGLLIGLLRAPFRMMSRKNGRSKTEVLPPM